jgi:hypothetical protein
VEIIYTNDSGISVTLRQIKPYFITKLDGVGRIRQSITTFHAPEQDGDFFVSSSVDMRNITIEGQILADNFEQSYDLRRNLLKIFTPKLRGTLTFRSRKISCIVEEAAFSATSSAKSPAFFISLLCPAPFFESINDTIAELASWQENFSFPLEVTSSGIELGYRQPSQIIEILNDGDVDCGLEIIFKALGNVENPELRKLETGEFMRINTTLTNGQEIHVFTHFANKKVILVDGNTQTNAFSLIDTDSTFFQLSTGINTLRYDSDSNLDLLEVEIKYRLLYLAI